MKKLIALHIALFFSFPPALAQVQDSVATDTTVSVQPDSLGQPDSLKADSLQSDSLQQPEAPAIEPEMIHPWKKTKPVGSSPVTNDSLLRWQVWPNWGDYQAYRNDAISYRQGTSGREDAFHINGYSPYEQEIDLEGVSLKNPVTGLINYNLVPHRKIAEVREGFFGGYDSEIDLKEYYIVQPRSFLNYDESKYEYRNLEFLVTQNFKASTNMELSYWDRRDGSYYRNSTVEGSQIVGRVYHHLNENYQLRAFYVRNQLNNNEPFGYVVNDPQAFAFSRFGSVPVSSEGSSEMTRWDLISGIYHRRDTNSVENAGFEVFLSKNKKRLTFTGDTLGWNLTTLGSRGFKDFNMGPLKIHSELEAIHHGATEGSVINRKRWNVLSAELSADYKITEGLSVFGLARTENRSDDTNSSELGGGVNVGLMNNRLKLKGGAFMFNRAPTIQSLYWNSLNYSGNPNLENESGFSLNGEAEAELFNTVKVGVKGRYKQADNATFLTADSSFSNSSSYNMYSGTVYAEFENHLFEIASSGTAQRYDYSDNTGLGTSLNLQDQVVWIRNSFFVKGYVFDRAAFMKIGLKALTSPLFYYSRTYNTELGFWQGNSTYQRNPPFFRLDAELSARVRSIMVVMRWENTLDGIGQAGYFEAAGFPMPPRRLIVGIRAQFRN